MTKKLMVTVVLAAAMIGGGTGAVLAGYGPESGSGGPPPGMGMGRGVLGSPMAKVLKLTDAQQNQIKEILDAEQEQVKPLLDKMHESRKLLMQASEATAFDEVEVRALAVVPAKIETELIVSRIRTQIKINALMTPEQRELQKLLRPDMDRLPSKGGE